MAGVADSQGEYFQDILFNCFRLRSMIATKNFLPNEKILFSVNVKVQRSSAIVCDPGK